MKQRIGFVSNSSSCSFLVSFNDVPKNVKELKKLLFGTNEKILNDVSGEYHSTSLLAKIIFNDMTKDNQAIILKSVNFSTEKDYDEYEKELFEKYRTKNPGKLFVFEYGNDSCISEPYYETRCKMEDIYSLFDKLPFLKQDNH